MKNSIRARFLLITALSTLVLFAFVYVIWNIQSTAVTESNQHLAQSELTETGATMLAEPVANGDQALVEAITRGLISNANVLALRVTNTDGAELASFGDTNNFSSRTHVIPLIVENNGDDAASPNVGVLQVVLADDRIEVDAASGSPTFLPTFLAFFIGSIVSAALALWWAVFRPLGRIVDEISPSVQYEHPDSATDEVASIVHAYNTMAERDDKHQEELTLLRAEYEDQLESKSFALTKEIAKRDRVAEEVVRAKEQVESLVEVRTQALKNCADSLTKANAQLSKEVDDLHALEKKLAKKAMIDALTKLPSRIALKSVAKRAFIKAQESKGKVGILLVDVDKFRTFSDALGHLAEERLLRDAVARITGVLHQEDSLVRFGGDEFVLFLNHEPTNHRIEQVSQAIVDAMAQPFEVENTIVESGAFIGISVFPQHGTKLDTLMRNADIALSRSKKQGHGQYTMYTPDQFVESKERAALKKSIKQAIASNQFEVYFQPVISMRTGTSHKLEALLRWHHPEKGTLMPAAFLSAAQDSGLLAQIDTEVLQQACAACREMLDEGLETTISVNLSCASLNDAGIVDAIVMALTTNGLMPESLCIEITEDVVVNNSEKVSGVLQQIYNMGVHLSIDDFGAGYSSLSVLQHLPIHELKLDQAFIGDLPDDGTTHNLVVGIVNLCRTLGITTVAEGVESIRQYKGAATAGCENIQGYLVSKPLRKYQIMEYLQTAPVYPNRSKFLARPPVVSSNGQVIKAQVG